ncbi:MAG: 50S ribosomal protein L21 [Bacteroidetes bacterium]|nr:50S ribosomal protein L21 [Bacteroidota bacterium]
MYAIVEIKGKQYKVREHETLYVPYVKSAQTDDTLTFDRVLLFANGDDIRVGAPTVDGAQITAKVLGHVKGDKVLVFKKRRRKRYRVKRGHRQQYTQIQIEALSPGGAKKKKAVKKAEKEAAPEAPPEASGETTEA